MHLILISVKMLLVIKGRSKEREKFKFYVYKRLLKLMQFFMVKVLRFVITT